MEWDAELFLKYKAEQGFWVFEKTVFNQIIFEG